MTRARDLASNSSGSKPTLIDAKADLIVGTGADAASRLAVGSNGDTIVADSAATVGLRYSATPSASNPVINGALDIWQRGTSTALTTTAYIADRWQGYRNAAGSTGSRQVTNDTTNLPNIQYCARIQRDSGNSSTTKIYVGHSLETVNSIPYAGKTITLSFYARKGADYSSSGSGLDVALRSGTGTDQNITTVGYTGSANVIATTQAITTTWVRYSFTGSVASTATELGVELSFTPVGTAGAADYFEFTGVQIDVGSVALPFRRAMNTLQGELAACQRYYFELADGTMPMGFGRRFNSSTMVYSVPLTVSMRTSPTVTYTGSVYYEGGGGGANSGTLSSPSVSLNRSAFVVLQATTSGTPLSGEAYIISDGKHTFSAEL